MQDYLFILPIAISLLLGVMSPGPSFLMVAQTAATKTRNDGIATAMGMGVGAALFAIAAAAGLYVLLESVPWLYLGLKIIGGLYLCYLAYKIWHSSDTPLTSNTQLAPKQSNLLRSFFIGLTTQLSNPKTAIVFMGIFAAFLPPQVPPYAYLIICSLAFCIDFFWYALVAMMLSTQKAQRTYARYQSGISKAAGGFMGIMGVKLASNQ